MKTIFKVVDALGEVFSTSESLSCAKLYLNDFEKEFPRLNFHIIEDLVFE